ncbi:MAG: outer membrane protein transport protein [Candidatus Hydrogenedentes bacterium]|nr:outer membrane protein transport protein [Candidatus Hydrogenedentota bacterium]
MTCAMCVAMAVCAAAAAQELEMSVSPSPVGSGARAAGMADAFVAVADDATAASWNPAGLVQLERPELSVALSYIGVRDEFSVPHHSETDSTHNTDDGNINYLSVVYPLPVLVLGRNVTLAFTSQHKYDFDRDLSIDYNYDWTNPSVLDMKWRQRGGLSTISPAVAVELTDRLSLGVALNVWDDSLLSDNGWDQTSHATIVSNVAGDIYTTRIDKHTEYSDVSGENVTVGMLFRISPKWDIGVRYDSSLVADARYRSRRSTAVDTESAPAKPDDAVIETVKERRRLRLPESFAVGVACHATDRLTASLDVTRTDWDDFYVKDAAGTRFSLVNAANLDDPDERENFDPTYTVRFGTEYVFIPDDKDTALDRLWTVRGGVFFDQEPASGSPDNFYGFATGLGLLIKQRFNIDLAYQLRYGHDVNSDFVRGLDGFEEDVIQHRVLLSAIVYF